MVRVMSKGGEHVYNVPVYTQCRAVIERDQVSEAFNRVMEGGTYMACHQSIVPVLVTAHESPGLRKF